LARPRIRTGGRGRGPGLRPGRASAAMSRWSSLRGFAIVSQRPRWPSGWGSLS